MKVSVVIPLYNHAHFIEQAMRSVLEQTHTNVELIVVDDGSKDNSADVAEAFLKQFPNAQAKLFRQENQGAHNAINFGLSQATGDFLTVLNSDDFYHTQRIERCVKALKTYGAECVFTIVSHVDDAGVVIAPAHQARNWYARSLAAENTAASISAQLMQGNIAVSSGNIIFSRRLYELTGGFRSFKLAHDWDFLLRVIPHSEPIFVKEALYFYRLHASNTSHEVNQFLYQETKAIYRDYFITIAQQEPVNPHAPSLNEWAFSFTGFQHRSLMQEAIKSLITFPEKKANAPTQHTPIPKGNGAHITLVSHDLSLSGAPRLVADIAIYLQEKGYRPHIIALMGGTLADELNALGISYSILYGGVLNKLRRFMPKKLYIMLTPLCVLSKIHQFKGVILCNTVVSQTALLCAMLLMPWKKFVWYVHESVPPSSLNDSNVKANAFEWIRKKIAAKNRFSNWFGSKNTAQLWVSEGVEGKVMYWSGIKASTTLPQKKTIKRILTAGTVDPRKGGHYLFEAFVECCRKGTIPDDVVLTIVGFLPYYTEFGYDFITKILRSGYKNRIEMIGITDKEELDKIFASADMYVQASIMECMPIALLTAMSQGKPIITTDVDGCKEAIPDERYGYICPPRHVPLLAEKLAEAIHNPEDAYQKGARAQQLFNDLFAREATAEALEKELFG